MLGPAASPGRSSSAPAGQARREGEPGAALALCGPAAAARRRSTHVSRGLHSIPAPCRAGQPQFRPSEAPPPCTGSGEPACSLLAAHQNMGGGFSKANSVWLQTDKPVRSGGAPAEGLGRACDARPRRCKAAAAACRRSNCALAGPAHSLVCTLRCCRVPDLPRRRLRAGRGVLQCHRGSDCDADRLRGERAACRCSLRGPRLPRPRPTHAPSLPRRRRAAAGQGAHLVDRVA